MAALFVSELFALIRLEDHGLLAFTEHVGEGFGYVLAHLLLLQGDGVPGEASAQLLSCSVDSVFDCESEG